MVFKIYGHFFLIFAIRKSKSSNNSIESLNRRYNESCVSNKTRKIIKCSFEFLSDQAQVKRLKQRKRNTQTLQRQQTLLFKQHMLKLILQIDISKLTNQSELQHVTRTLFNAITSTINLTDE